MEGQTEFAGRKEAVETGLDLVSQRIAWRRLGSLRFDYRDDRRHLDFVLGRLFLRRFEPQIGFFVWFACRLYGR